MLSAWPSLIKTQGCGGWLRTQALESQVQILVSLLLASLGVSLRVPTCCRERTGPASSLEVVRWQVAGVGPRMRQCLVVRVVKALGLHGVCTITGVCHGRRAVHPESRRGC